MMGFTLLGLVLLGLTHGWRTVIRSRFFLHRFQLEGYRVHRTRDWWMDRGRRLLIRPEHVMGAIALGVWSRWGIGVGTLLVLWCILFASAIDYLKTPIKKPLAWTPRMRRLTVLTGLLTGAVALGVLWSVNPLMGTDTAILMRVMCFLLMFELLVPYTLVVASGLLTPVESGVREGFKRQARARLARREDLTIVGITGSYGKTSTKVAIAELLSQRHEVLATPGSFNTPMGLCLVINEQLQRSHEVAVLEYGIRYPGDMQELVDLVRPTIAVVSALGIAHLETMGSESAIDREKGLLVEALPADGHAVLNADDARVLALRSRTQGRVWTVSVTGDADIRAFDVTYSDRGMSFIVQDETGDTAPFEIALLGAHNVTNVLLAVAVGRVLRTPLRALARAARRLRAVPHRLALRQEGPLTIIDDAFNSNPSGAREAIDVLGRVSRGRRIVVTPGMIELGAQQDAENRAWGAYMAGRVDHVYLVGAAQTKPIYEGLLSEGFPVEAIHVVDQFQDARAALLDAAQPGDVVLYENDLPDQFNEG